MVQNKTEIVQRILLKDRNEKNEKLYKSYKSLFESVECNSKGIYYSSKILQFKNNAKKTWGVMKELIVKIRTNKLSLHKNLVIGKKRNNWNKRYSRRA